MKRATNMLPTMKMKLRNQKGFTLVEILVVISILALLATVATLKYVDSTATSRTAKAQSDLEAIDVAIHLYGANYAGSLPANLAILTPTYMPVAPAGAAGDYKISGAKITALAAPTYAIDSNGRATITIEGTTYTSDTLHSSN